MDVNAISPVSYKANVKKMTAPLKNGKTFKLEVGDNYYDALITKGNNVIEGIGKKSSKGFSEVAEDLGKTVSRIQPEIQEGFDFIKEFIVAILK